jgi:hypothetical protein
MRKAISLSALLSGVLAAPLMGHAKLLTGASPDPATIAQMRAHLDAVTGGEPLEAERMHDLHQRIAARVQAQIDRALATRVLPAPSEAPALFFVQMAATPDLERAEQERDAHLLLLDPNGLQIPTEKAAFLGVATSPASPLLRDQLKLHRGMGLVVEFVAPDSPAMRAGMQPHDVLEKLDDQWLVDGPQFAALVRAKKPGDTLTLTLLRAGERQKITVTLAEKELPVLEDQESLRLPANTPGLLPMPYDGAANGPTGWEPWQRGSRKTVFTAPDGTTTRTLKDGTHDIALTTSPQGETRLLIKDAAGHPLYAGPYMTDADKAAVPRDCAKAVQELAAITARAAVGTNTSPAANRPPATATMVRSDADHQMVLKTENGRKTLRVKDVQTGKILFDGPVDTDEEIAALPSPIAEKMKWMQQKMGLGK